MIIRLNLEENDDIQFEPVIQMPEKVDLVTGEEDEQVLYSQRVKLFRFDVGTSQWKERGVGVLKFLKNTTNGRLRVLMRREQVLKVCANHWITTTMNLKPLAGSDKAWVWSAMDFAEEGEGKLEQLAVRFKLQETANTFKQVFEEAKDAQGKKELMTPVTSRVVAPQDSGTPGSAKTTPAVSVTWLWRKKKKKQNSEANVLHAKCVKVQFLLFSNFNCSSLSSTRVTRLNSFARK
uniref:RanBD1 domain-containing protein n=1 Tax=Oreochromis aureus TaxID=47969 RepID=A0AAZ1XC84_OREAU